MAPQSLHANAILIRVAFSNGYKITSFDKFKNQPQLMLVEGFIEYFCKNLKLSTSKL